MANLIYGLRDPRNDVYKYIGKTTIGNGRPLEHLTHSHNSFVNEWVTELSKLGQTPYVDIIEKDIPLEKLADKERYYISYYSGQLFNLNPGNTIECINRPSVLDHAHLDNTLLTLINPGEVWKMLKMSTAFSDSTIAAMLNVRRKTVYRLKEGLTTIMLETVIRMIFFAKTDLRDLFNFYYENSHEFVGDYPDTYESFIIRCNFDDVFTRTWCNKFYTSKVIVNKVVYNKRSKKKSKKMS
jgi:hypothetical protein